ncbi:3-deoxy-manno-octulosonate cytidylyltransferase [Vibrio stylophorae]|uniref:3-deoxy-manno-octulosonate cytidylyltransferase n=1 Tax=Vibrio stylophorae TaxID=659351 RepID=A0ABM8ZTW1_9VIBR|nr:3-deoxy-manno-octulosonate cytidylyltransferase [Vibrio stylophorae]CAH0533758.1 3-deoxy-manno-octulosonate cytidylyltransferase [Vibrio stylophorae]
MSFTVIIPARYASSRLPAKPLADIAGKPMIQWVYERALASNANRVIIATDDQRVFDAAKDFGAEVCLTSADHQSGTERLAEVVAHYQLADDEIVVNVQGDEPLIPVEMINQVAANLARFSEAPMATLAVPMTDIDEVFNPNAVKVVMDQQGFALYFSRASVPWQRDHFNQAPAQLAAPLHRHIGIYGYRAGFISRYVSWQASPLEQLECLEQLRVLWYGEKIHVDVVEQAPPAGVDTLEDLERVRAYLQSYGNA